MPNELQGNEPRFKVERPTVQEISQTEKQLNEIIPILAHGLVRRLEQIGLRGRVTIKSIAGEDWSVGVSLENPAKDVPDVIVYPRDYLKNDKRLVNALLRHEIGNLNYPIEGELNTLREWCKKKQIAPELVTPLVEAVQEASVNYLEMQNSHSSNPQENFQALYEQEINTEEIARKVADAAPYKQAIDISLLYCLSQAGLVPAQRVETALANAHPSVRQTFDKQTRSLLDQAMRIAAPNKKVQLVRDYLWPKFSKLVGLPTGALPSEEQTDPLEGEKPEELEEGEQSKGYMTESKMKETKENIQKLKEQIEKLKKQLQSKERPSQQQKTKKVQSSDATKTEKDQLREEGLEHKNGGDSESQGGGEQDGKNQEDRNGSENGQGQGAGSGASESEGGESDSGPEKNAQGEGSLNDLYDKPESELNDLGKKLADLEQKMTDELEGAGNGSGDGEGQDGGQANKGMREGSGEGEAGSGQGQPSGGPHNVFKKGGKTQDSEMESLFSKPSRELLNQLKKGEATIKSKFNTQDQQGNSVAKLISKATQQILEKSDSISRKQAQTQQLQTLESIKHRQQAKLESIYREMSELDGEALRIYIEHMESMKDFIRDLIEFFVERFQLDQEYLYSRNQLRGARLQKAYLQNIVGVREGTILINPRSLERKRPPEKPQFAWSLIIDDSGSCGGEIIEQEKKLAVALIEVAKALDIPFEIVTFGGPEKYTFLKTFGQDVVSEDLQKMVLLNADQGTPDVITLEAACTSMRRFADKFKHSYNFVYFMTDGQSGGGSIKKIIEKFKRDMVITGIGLANAANTIGQTWGENALEVPDPKNLSSNFIKKVERQIEQTFD